VQFNILRGGSLKAHIEISWADRVLYRAEEGRNILPKIYTRKASWIGHILCRNRLLKHVIEGKREGRIEVTERRGKRRKQLLDYFKEKRVY
jgi:hypothetical protein